LQAKLTLRPSPFSRQVVRALLELGCDPALLDDQGRTAADLAQQRVQDTHSAVAEMVLRTLTQPPPSASKVFF